ncbi:MAG: HD domain-containing protein [Candidatus Competibacteraceae bacterium]|nr:HD domain-containing protein [Candidatus Competibacteraceae bacterium]
MYYIHVCFRLAALLHDTGHFPFSHEFEQTESIKNILRNSNILRDFWGKSDLHEKYAKNRLENSDFAASHEDYSLAVAYKILKSVSDSLGLPVEIDDVLCLMESHSHGYTTKWIEMCGSLFEVLEGKSSTRESYDPKLIADGIRSFFSIMISGEIDVDKMDYLLRDSYFSGAKYGIYNLDHLLSTLRIGFNQETKWVGLAILEKGLVALEDFVYSRFQIYQNMWSHKAVVGTKLLLAEAMRESLSDNVVCDVKSYLSDEVKFTFFTDHYFLEKFRANCMQKKSPAAERFLFRSKYKYLGRLVNPQGDSINEKLIELRKLSESTVVYRRINIKFSKIHERDFSSIKVITHQHGKKRVLHQLNQVSDFFRKFDEGLIVNFYDIK